MALIYVPGGPFCCIYAQILLGHLLSLYLFRRFPRVMQEDQVTGQKFQLLSQKHAIME